MRGVLIGLVGFVVIMCLALGLGDYLVEEYGLASAIIGGLVIVSGAVSGAWLVGGE